MPRRPRRRTPALLTAVLLLLPVPAATSEVLSEAEAGRLVTEALERNPELRAARDAAAAAVERVRPAGALPDPMFSLSYENDGASPSLGEMEMTRLALMVEQQIPFPGSSGSPRRSPARTRSARRPAPTGPSWRFRLP